MANDRIKVDGVIENEMGEIYVLRQFVSDLIDQQRKEFMPVLAEGMAYAAKNSNSDKERQELFCAFLFGVQLGGAKFIKAITEGTLDMNIIKTEL